MVLPISTTRVFNSGHSQAVPIPAEFRLNTDQVQISHTESGDLPIHPIPAERGQDLLQVLQALGEVDEKFIAALEAEQAHSQPKQVREALNAVTGNLKPCEGWTNRLNKFR